MKFNPIKDRIIVKPDEALTKTKAGIIIPETVKEQPLRGTVVAVGKGYAGESMESKEGDVVRYAKRSGVEIDINDVTHLIMREGDIYGYEQ